MAASTKFYSLVCAIDFGTTFSGYAYSRKVEYQDKPLDIVVPEWDAPSSVQISKKTPTTLLLDKDKKFVAFGYEAENNYAQFAEEEDNEDYFYIRQFKMMLYNALEKERLTKETLLRDITGKKEIKAITIFMHAIRYFQNLMLTTIERKGLGVKEEHIRWVLTVPAIWSDPAKKFMTEAAELAGIKRENLRLALEPEAASIYCNRLPFHKEESGLICFNVGQKYMVLDAGGGTVDITVHEVMEDSTLKELEQATGGQWGGTSVDSCFLDFLSNVLTPEVMNEFCLKHTGEYIEFFRDFEMKKRSVKITNQTKVTMRIPATLPDFYEEIKHKPLKEAIQESEYSKMMKWEGGKLRIIPKLFESFFSSPCTGILTHVKELLKKPNVEGTDTIIMVGGFSESEILQKFMKKELNNCKVVVPNEPVLAVLKGAVLFGHNPSLILERISKYWYGIASFTEFNPNIHKVEKKKNNFCEDIFNVIIPRGTAVKLEETQTVGPYETNRDDQKEMDFDIYVSNSDKQPMYVTDEDCHYLGTLTVQLPKGKKCRVFINFKLGGTELHVEATNDVNKDMTKATFEILETKHTD